MSSQRTRHAKALPCTPLSLMYRLRGAVKFHRREAVGQMAKAALPRSYVAPSPVLSKAEEKKKLNHARQWDRSPNPSATTGHIFPRKGGFFNDPAAAPQRATFSVFHQLHCLLRFMKDGIRHGYWAVYLAAMEGRKLDPAELPMMASPRHIRHCIDLLRQGLMCCADSTVEVKEGDADGVKGFGTTHYCRDWEQLVQWTSDVQARSSVHGG
ncbi:hypothetical protein MMC18_004492 [Xylographa bjoerkii]|nr:hypothetical protein [Xylographa bjoerkii]